MTDVEPLLLGVHAAEFDLATAPDIKAELLGRIAAEPGRDVVIDLGAVAFMDSSGVGALVSIHNAVQAAGRALSVRRVQPSPFRVLTIMHLVAKLNAFEVNAGDGAP